MTPILDFNQPTIYRGSILKFRNTHNLDDDLCLMLCEIVGKSEFQLIVVNNYKAGCIYWHLPKEANSEDDLGISVKWLIEHKSKWETDCLTIHNLYILSEPDSRIFNY